MSVFDNRNYDDHEDVLFCRDARTGLKAIIAIHSTHLGPAAGGCRMFPYKSVEDALTDALRLSRGMTYKNAIAGLPLGGGKSVIVADPASDSKEALLRSFARHVQRLAGAYWTAIDIGVSPIDADIMAEECDYVFARASQYEEGFDASLPTALGVFVTLRSAVRNVLQRDDLRGVRVAVQGVGKTGRELVRLLTESGAEVIVTDVDADALEFVVDTYGVTVVDVDSIHAQDVDVYAPCAMGCIVNDNTISEIRARIICGAANNQLDGPHIGADLQERGIAYVPDFLANGGGMIAAGSAIYGTPDPDWSEKKIQELDDEVQRLLCRAKKEGRPAVEIAELVVDEMLASLPSV